MEVKIEDDISKAQEGQDSSEGTTFNVVDGSFVVSRLYGIYCSVSLVILSFCVYSMESKPYLRTDISIFSNRYRSPHCPSTSFHCLEVSGNFKNRGVYFECIVEAVMKGLSGGIVTRHRMAVFLKIHKLVNCRICFD